MSIMDFFASQGTATPSPDVESGDWMDWFLNREGPAGRFRGSRRPRHGIDYLFNGGGSVHSEPSFRSVQSGPKTRQKLQPRAPEAWHKGPAPYNPGRAPEYFKGPAPYNPGRAPEYFKGPAPYNPDRNTPGKGYLLPNTQEPWNNPGPGSYWNASLQSENNPGIMSAMTDYSPDGQGRWMTQSPTGNKLLSYLVNQLGSEGSSEYLEAVLGGGGISAFGGKWRPTWGDGQYGITGKWNLQDLFGEN